MQHSTFHTPIANYFTSAGALANADGSWLNYEGEQFDDSAAMLDGTWDWANYKVVLDYLQTWFDNGYLYEDCGTIKQADGVPLIRQIVEMFEVAGITTEIICASVRHPIHVTECALAGADIATVPYKVIEQMTKHPLTDAGIEKFQKDYKAVFGDK